jgi:hypothetical protein
MPHNIDHIDSNESPGTSQSGAQDRPNWLAVAIGFAAALVIAYVACRPPQSHTLSWTARFLISTLYLLLVCLAGTAGTWIALPGESRKHFRRLTLWGARGWVFLPAVMIFLRQRSLEAPLLAAIAAATMATYLARFIDPPPNPLTKNAEQHEEVEKLFTTQISIGPTSWIPFGISLFLYGTLTSAANGKLALATLLFAAAIFLLVPQLIAAAQKMTAQAEEAKKRTHPYALLAIAFCFVFVGLSASAGHSNFDMNPRAFHIQESAQASPIPSKHSSGASSAGYRTIVLWPIQKKKKVIPSPPQNIQASSRHSSKPWVIPFYGPYLYFKTIGETSGPRTDIAHGDSLKVNVRSTDREPLLMEAHQTLPDPVDMDCCREIQLVLKNDPSLGASEVGLSLTDSHSPGKITQNLGIKYIGLDSTAQRVGDGPFSEETLSFPIPKSAKIKKFDQITVILFPDPKHLTAGRKVAVERFIMIPN